MDNDKILQEEGEVILPITHETCVLNDAGQPITETIGNISNLYTKEKTLVGAVNEVYTSSLKQQMVEILLDKGIDCNINMTFVEILDLFRGINIGSGLDIISATELPATGRENQICVITDNPVDNYLITTRLSDNIYQSDRILVYLGSSDINSDSVLLPVTNGNITTNYYFNNMRQGEYKLASYYYQNNTWNMLTMSAIPIYENGTFLNKSIIGNISSDYNSQSTYIQILGVDSMYKGFSFSNNIDFSNYTKVIIQLTVPAGASNQILVVGSYKTHEEKNIMYGGNVLSSTDVPFSVKQTVSNTGDSNELQTFTFDISSWSGGYYLAVLLQGSAFVNIYNITLI